MLTPVEIAALIGATKSAVDLFDKIAGQVKSVLLKRPKEAEGAEDRWRHKIGSDGKNIIVTQQSNPVQVISGDQLARTLAPEDLSLVRTYEQNMQKYFRRWQAEYAKKDGSQDPLANAIVEEQLAEQIGKMKGELLGILAFLERIGVRLDDHYMHIRHLVQEAV